MKELETIPSIEVRSEQEQKKVQQLIRQQRRIPGLTLFEFNTKDSSIRPASFEKINVELKPQATTHALIQHRKVLIKSSCVYIQALNEKNARRKFAKIGFV
jgi:hypothetical protein